MSGNLLWVGRHGAHGLWRPPQTSSEVVALIPHFMERLALTQDSLLVAQLEFEPVSSCFRTHFHTAFG